MCTKQQEIPTREVTTEEHQTKTAMEEKVIEEKTITKNLVSFHELVERGEETEEEMFVSLLNKYPMVIVDFYAKWCGPCQTFGPVFDKVSKQERDIFFIKVDVDASPIIVSKYNVRSMPTVLLFKDGQKVDQKKGAMSATELKALLRKTFRD
jgi:thioredoxin